MGHEMTLVDRLRGTGDYLDREAGDRIEALEIMERTGREEAKEFIARIERLEAALREIIEYESGSDTHPVVRLARRALERHPKTGPSES